MGRYIKVVLKRAYKNDLFILVLNEVLVLRFGANDWDKFNPWYLLDSEANFMNTHPEGLKQIPDWKRPIKAETLSKNFFWFTNGEFTMKLSGETTIEDAIDVISVAKWIAFTKRKYIDQKQSHDYDFKTLKQYLNYLFEDQGITTDDLWTI